MEIRIEGRHFKLTEAIQTHVREKLKKLEKYFDGIYDIHVILDAGNEKLQKVELICAAAKRKRLVAVGEAEDLYVAVDVAEKKMVAEMKKLKARLRGVVRGKVQTAGTATVTGAQPEEAE